MSSLDSESLLGRSSAECGANADERRKRKPRANERADRLAHDMRAREPCRGDLSIRANHGPRAQGVGEPGRGVRSILGVLGRG